METVDVALRGTFVQVSGIVSAIRRAIITEVLVRTIHGGILLVLITVLPTRIVCLPILSVVEDTDDE